MYYSIYYKLFLLSNVKERLAKTRKLAGKFFWFILYSIVQYKLIIFSWSLINVSIFFLGHSQ